VLLSWNAWKGSLLRARKSGKFVEGLVAAQTEVFFGSSLYTIETTATPTATPTASATPLKVSLASQ
jgi:hypothetical protein